jgi:hypothetical protein
MRRQARALKRGSLIQSGSNQNRSSAPPQLARIFAFIQPLLRGNATFHYTMCCLSRRPPRLLLPNRRGRIDAVVLLCFPLPRQDGWKTFADSPIREPLPSVVELVRSALVVSSPSQKKTFVHKVPYRKGSIAFSLPLAFQSPPGNFCPPRNSLDTEDITGAHWTASAASFSRAPPEAKGRQQD